MRGIILLAGIFAALAVTVGSASGPRTVTVTITKKRCFNVPSSAAIRPGEQRCSSRTSDTVGKPKGDVFKTTQGCHVHAEPWSWASGSGGTCTFQSGATSTYTDPKLEGQTTFRGTISVTAPLSRLSLTGEAPLLVAYGGSSSLVSGVLVRHSRWVTAADVARAQCGSCDRRRS